MIPIDEYSVVVFNQSDLEIAVGGANNYQNVYLGADIIMTAGITVHSSKTKLVVDGINPLDENGVVHTLTDEGSDSGMIIVNAGMTLDIAFQNMSIAGRNYWGMPCVRDGNPNVVLTYRKVKYTGPQLTWHASGLTRYLDCDITLAPGTSAMHEIGEVRWVEIGGKTRIHHNTSYGAFLFYYNTDSSFTILPDAEVEITTDYDLFRGTPAFVIGPRARFTLTTDRGMSNASGYYARSFLVDESANFRYVRKTSTGTSAALYVRGPFTVNAGASVYMEANFSNTGRLIQFARAEAGLYLNNCKRFVVYNAGSATGGTALGFTVEVPYSFTGGQLNLWKTAKPLGDAGTFRDYPEYRWHKLEWESFGVEGMVRSDRTTINTTTLIDDTDPEKPLSDLKLHEARVISFGTLPLQVNPVVDDGRPVTGTSEGLAEIIVSYEVEPLAGSQRTGTCDVTGVFSVTTGEEIPAETDVIVDANREFLYTTATLLAVEVGELWIKEAPEIIAFSPRAFQPSPPLLQRLITDAPVIIGDERVETDRTQWELWASITDHLKTVENDVLYNAVVFALEDGTLETLEIGTPKRVYTAGPYVETETTVRWVANRGVLVRITNAIRSGIEYRTELIWEIRPSIPPEPIDPDDGD